MNNQDLTLIKKYYKAIETYYAGNPIMSDAAFDAIETDLLNRKVIDKKVRFETPNTVKVTHKIIGIDVPLLSLPAIHTKSKFDKALYDDICNRTQAYQHLAMLKYDGMSCEATYDQYGRLIQVATKGDGYVGYDCTQKWLKSGKIPAYINNVKQCIVQIRFEAVIPKDKFGKLAELGYANERNAASGIVKRQDDKFIEYVDPIAYIVSWIDANDESGTEADFRPVMTGNSKALLTEFGWNPNYIAGQWDFDSYDTFVHECEIVVNTRNELQYRIDGIVIYPNNADFYDIHSNGAEYTNMVALKLDAQSAITKVTGIEWRQRINGELFPRVLLEPVELDGTIVKAASGFNWGFVYENDIYAGSLVRIEKGGDIIPDIQECIEPGKTAILEDEALTMSKHWKRIWQVPYEDAYIDGIHLMVPEEYAAGKRFINAMYNLGIDGMGYAMANRIMEAMIAKQSHRFDGDCPTFQAFFELVMDDIKHLQLAKEDAYKLLANDLNFDTTKKSDAKVIIGIATRCTHIYADQYLRCLQVPGLGSKACQELAKDLAGMEHSYWGLNESPINFVKESKMLEQYHKYAGKTIVTAKQIQQIEEAKHIANVSTYGLNTTPVQKVKVVMTGSPKSAGFKTKQDFLNACPELQDVGDDVDNCNMVLTNDLSKSSSKMKKAQAKGAKIMTYEDYIKEHPIK